MPKHVKYPKRMSNKDIRKQAKQESGKFASKGKGTGTKLGTFIRKTTTKSKYGLKRVGRGTELGNKPARRVPPVKPPKTDIVSIGIRKIKGKTTPSGKSIEVSKFDASGKTQKEISQKLIEGEKVTGVKVTKEIDKKATTKGGDVVLAKNKAKLSAFQKAKAERSKRIAEGKYVPGSRTQSQRAKDAALDLAKARLGTRKLFKVLKKQKKKTRAAK